MQKQTTNIRLSEIIAENKKRGFEFVAHFGIYCLWKKKNAIGGWTYISERLGNEGAIPILDTDCVSKEELRAIIADMDKPASDEEELAISLVELVSIMNNSPQEKVAAMLVNKLDWRGDIRAFLIKRYNLNLSL